MKKHMMKMVLAMFFVLGVTMLWNMENTATGATSYIDQSLVTESDGELYWKKNKIGILNEQGQIIFSPLEDYTKNANALEALLLNDQQKTLVLPEGTNLQGCYDKVVYNTWFPWD